MKRSIKALLFADVKAYSKMSERECLAFCRTFHSGVQREVLSRYDELIVRKNTWGDALHVVMDDLVAAAHLALDLRDWVAAQKWEGLSKPPQIRIGLHAGVVEQVPDPIAGEGRFNYVGRNTSRAARIEPITYEGQVFASQVFAALFAIEGDGDVMCEYVGERELPKGAGKIKVYQVSRK